MIAAASLPTPVELGFPAKFTSWYPDQLQAIDRIVLGTKRFTALAMPTGSGKSVTGIVSALLHPEVTRALYLTSTKGLQDQLSEFSALGLVDLRGARNYPCLAVQPGGELDRFTNGGRYAVGCDEGPCRAGVRCSLAPVRGDADAGVRPGCRYFGALHDARRATLVATNYAMYFASEAYSEGLNEFDLLILDEAHDADKELESFLTLEVTGDDFKVLGGRYLQSETLEDWRSWAIHHRPDVAGRIESRQIMAPDDPEGVADLQRLKALLGKLERIAKLVPVDWILDNDGHRAKFAPIRVSQYAEEVLFRKIPHVLLMSATMTRKTTQMLGIKADDLAFWEVPSRFSVKRRPIISLNTSPPCRVGFKMDDTARYMWIRRIDSLIEPRRQLGRKGIIHTVSYARMKELLASSEHRDMMMVHDTGNTREVVRAFKSIKGPRILVSPSIITGYDFPDNECRYQIIGKVPQLNTSDPISKVRKETDVEWTGYVAMQKLVQACGRGMRGPNDWCETIVVDDHFADWFLQKYRKHAPRWFLDAIEYWETYPPPMVDPNVQG